MRVVVAMSGGVDSSVAAGLLVREGHEVIGVHMRLHDESTTAVPTSRPGRCCGYDDALDARKVAASLDIPFYVMNLREVFARSVMKDLADTYLRGETPNPCIQCNGRLKFRVLMSRARALGADRLATGHYARIREDGALACAVDEDKDQSYFLFSMTPDARAQTWFPLGGMTKAEVRAQAESLELPVADKPESQEICFIPDGDHARFVAEQHPDVDASGPVLLEDGTEVGQHEAYYRYTVGQRRGLGVALGQAAWVLRIDPDTRAVTVTTAPERLGSMGLVASGAVWHGPLEPEERVTVRIRHRGTKHPARVVKLTDKRFEVHFEDPVRAIAPGQAAVVYRGDEVVGGGWIGRACRRDELTALSGAA